VNFCTPKFLSDNVRVIKGFISVSKSGARTRVSAGLLELVPQLLYYSAQALVVFSAFSEINGVEISTWDLGLFLLVMCGVDSLGDAIIFKGIGQYCQSLRRSQVSYYLTTPGSPLLKVILLRSDIPMIILGLAFMSVAVSLVWIKLGLLKAISLAAASLFGVLVHGVLTSAFFIIQAFFDPKMPIVLGSPASRFYSKPLHLVLTSGLAVGILGFLYPAFFITAFPAGLVSRVDFLSGIGVDPMVFGACGLASVSIWMIALNEVIKRTCEKWS
jgi:hypothetical protein